MDHLAAIIVILTSLVGIVLTLLTLPGTWFMLVAAMLVWWWRPDMYEPWTIGVAGVLALLGEALEFVSSAAGSAKAGGSRRGAVGSIAGAIAGAILGTPFLPPIGTIAGGVLGAGAGAVLAERLWAKRTWAEAARSGQGAAVGRLAATILKTGVAVGIGVVLVVGAYNA